MLGAARRSRRTQNEEEQAWLAAHPQLRLGVDASWPPFEFRDEQGRYHRPQRRLCRADRKAPEGAHAPRGATQLERGTGRRQIGQLDLLPGIMSTPERQRDLAFTRPYLDFPIVILARRDGPQPLSLSELYGLKIAVVQDYAPHELLRNHHPDLNLLPLPSVAAALQALATDQADAMVGDLASSVWSMRQLKLKDL